MTDAIQHLTLQKFDTTERDSILNDFDKVFILDSTPASLDSLLSSDVSIDFGEVSNFDGKPTLQNSFALDDKTIHSLTATSAMTLSGFDTSILSFASDATIGTADLSKFTITSNVIQVTDTLNFNGAITLQDVTITAVVAGSNVDAKLGANLGANAEAAPGAGIVLNFGQSDNVARTVTIEPAGNLSLSIVTDAFSFLDLTGSIKGTMTLNGGGALKGTALFGGTVCLNGEAALTSEATLFVNGINDPLLVGFFGDSANNSFRGGDVEGAATAGPTFAVSVDMGAGNDSFLLNGDLQGNINMGKGADVFILVGDIGGEVIGGHGNDVLDLSRATLLNATLDISGGNGHDTITGSSGADIIQAGGGNDKITGGEGRDQLIGRSGKDTFIFDATDSGSGGGNRDVIRDFTRGEDLIDLSSFANTFTAGGAFTNRAGEVIATSKFVMVDVDGDGAADFEINMRRDLGLTADDFILDVI